MGTPKLWSGPGGGGQRIERGACSIGSTICAESGHSGVAKLSVPATFEPLQGKGEREMSKEECLH